MNEYSCNYDYNKLKFDCTMKHVSLSVNKIVGYSILQLHGKDKCKFNTLMIQVNVNNLDGHSPGFTELICSNVTRLVHKTMSRFMGSCIWLVHESHVIVAFVWPYSTPIHFSCTGMVIHQTLEASLR